MRYGDYPPRHLAQTDRARDTVEVEDDGLPVQSPPLMRSRRIADDPSEPFSPNYGAARARDDLADAAARAPSRDVYYPPVEASYRAGTFRADR